MSKFLTAHWANLLNVTFRVPPEFLQAHVPPGLELDVQDGDAFASIVAFEFLNTRVKGLKIPFHVNFPEINLRFYVKDGDTRGVVFLKELVPKHCIALVARRIYNEPYEACPMKVSTQQAAGEIELRHTFTYHHKDHQIWAKADLSPSLPSKQSIIHYFKEHEWGFGVNHRGKTLKYRVEHPAWDVYQLTEYKLDMDFESIYGAPWGFLHDAPVAAACLAAGSDIAVYPADQFRITSE